MDKPVVLCIDDEKIVLDSIREELIESLKNDYEIEIADNGEDALEIFISILEEGKEIPLVISDYIMPGIKGDELLKRIHEISPKTLKVMLTGQADIKALENAINHANLYRFIKKPWERSDFAMTALEAIRSYNMQKLLEEKNKELAEINMRLEEMVRIRTEELENKINELTETKLLLEKTNQKLGILSALDGLTGIPNRRSFNDYIEREFYRAKRDRTKLAIIMLDVDFFKRYNDTYGYLSGDDTLKKIAMCLSSMMRRPADFAARYGGEEFVVVLPDTEEEGACHLAEEIRKEVEKLLIPHKASEAKDVVTVSLGVATIEHWEDMSIAEFIEKADNALYEAKQSGRNKYMLWD